MVVIFFKSFSSVWMLMYILGINGGVRLGYKDISAALIKDGEVIGAVEEERLNRVKHSPGQLPVAY